MAKTKEQLDAEILALTKERESLELAEKQNTLEGKIEELFKAINEIKEGQKQQVVVPSEKKLNI